MNTSVSGGVTLVEVVVAIAVIAIFINLFFILFGDLGIYRIETRQRDIASDIAYSNLQKFSKVSQITIGGNCSAKMDMTTANPPGLVIGDDSGTLPGFTPENTSELGVKAHQKVLAFAPYGCSSAALNKLPLKIVSTVTYGAHNREISHVAYIY